MPDLTSPTTADALRVPALKAHMGDWIYYSAFLTMKDISERVSFADEIHKHQGLRDMIQRSIDKSGHAESIKQYLLGRKQRFFNALVIGVYGGEPNFFELDLKSSPLLDASELPTYFAGALGILQFSGGEKLFAIDGQHRVAGIKRALLQAPELGSEEVIALFVSHARDAPGMERSRRLFTTLNRYAKPVSKMDIIALDEDDVVAIVTRLLVEEYPLFRNFLKIKKGKALQVSDVDSFTTIETLYEALDTFLEDQGGWSDFKRARPSDGKIKAYYRRAVNLWDVMQRHFPEIKGLAQSKKGTNVAGEFRNRQGGHLLFRPVGLLLAVEAIKRLVVRGKPLNGTIARLAKAPLEIEKAPWDDLLWDTVNKRMIVSSENRRVAGWILYHGMGGGLKYLNKSAHDVRQEWAGIVNRDVSKVRLRRWNA